MRSGAVVVATGLLLVLVGCVPSTPHATDSPQSNATPVFTSDAAALKAAEAAYAAYLKVSDQILHDGGQMPDRLLKVATPPVYKNEAEGYASARSSGLHSKGDTTFGRMSLQSVDANRSKSAVTVYVCKDVSAVDILDKAGKSVVSASRPDKTAFEVSFDVNGSGSGLIVSGKRVWSGAGVC